MTLCPNEFSLEEICYKPDVMQYQCFRTHLSSYYPGDFIKKEQELLEGSFPLKYVENAQELDPRLPRIILTDSHSLVEHKEKRVFENCQLTIHSNSGHDNFSESFIRESSFPIILGNEIRTQAVTEAILSFLFLTQTKIPESKSWDKSRNWNRKLLSEQSVLIIGLGNIGSLLQETISPLCKSIHCYDPQKGFENWPALPPDIVILCCSLTKTSKNIINKDFFQKATPELLLINTARGELIDFLALTNFLEKNPKANAYIDVFPEEPFPIENYQHLSNMKMSSHIAGVYHDIYKRVLSFEYNVLNDYFNQEKKLFDKKYDRINLLKKLKREAP